MEENEMDLRGIVDEIFVVYDWKKKDSLSKDEVLKFVHEVYSINGQYMPENFDKDILEILNFSDDKINRT